MAGELKPCPFCGSHRIKANCLPIGYHKVSAKCQDCGGEGPWYDDRRSTAWADAAIAWNRRAQQEDRG